MARIAIVGAGVVGVATAWQLCRDGHEVTLVGVRRSSADLVRRMAREAVAAGGVPRLRPHHQSQYRNGAPLSPA